MLKDDTIVDIFGKVVDDLEKKLENIEKLVGDLEEMLDGLEIQKLGTCSKYYITYKDIYYAMPNHLFSVFNEPKVVIVDHLYRSEILRYPTYFDILREGFKSSYDPKEEYRGYYSGFSGSLVDIEEKEEIDGVKYYSLFFYPG